jgi:hypothetical protein
VNKESQGFMALAGILAGLVFVGALVFGSDIAMLVDGMMGKASALAAIHSGR